MSELQRRLSWLHDGSRLLFERLATVPDLEFTQPTALPRWSRAHVVAHLGCNALALSRLVHWARTGEETPMYASAEARNDEIEQGARLPTAQLCSLASDADLQLRDALTELTDRSWLAEVRTAQGRTVKASEIPWLRVRELWVHGVDLDIGMDFADFPAALVDALIDDAVTMRVRRGVVGPSVVMNPTDRGRGWRLGNSTEQPVLVRAPATAICRWLTGRGELAGAPELDPWL